MQITYVNIKKSGKEFSIIDVVPSIFGDRDLCNYILLKSNGYINSPIFITTRREDRTTGYYAEQCFVDEGGTFANILSSIHHGDLDWKTIEILS